MPDVAAREVISAPGAVQEQLPSGLYRVSLEGEGRAEVLAHLAGGGSLLRLRPGDAVVVELMPYDMSRGRIVRRRS
jgi:translation initiation factor IF-1